MSDRRQHRWRPGPGLLVTAAFIGPGTVTTASRAGGEYGLALLWTLVVAVFAAIVLQEMAARLGVVGRLGLSEAIAATVRPAWLRRLALGLVLTAIVLGNSAYQTGNLTGAGMGAELLVGQSGATVGATLGVLVAVALWFGGESKRLKSALVAIVLAMSVAFVVTSFAAAPTAIRQASDFAPLSLPTGAGLTAIALLGTTVVPYNLFLHAATAKRHWSAEAPDAAITAARWDAALAIGLGGAVTAAIVITAAAHLYGSEGPIDARALATQLTPLLGGAGEWLFGFGLLAAGLTSAITAPLAAGYAAAGVFPSAGPKVVRGVAAGVSLVGGLFAGRFGESPQATIVTAQAANGLLLPLVACFLLWVMNRPDLLGEHRNGWKSNVAGAVVVAAAIGLGVNSLRGLLY